ncbi:MAG: response regulator transcription factor [Sediminibacterium sp.]|nr:response regulator transcription factor [Sediminibacterium sp.]
MHLTQNIRIIIADDHEIYRDGLRIMLEKNNPFEVVAEVNNGYDLIDLAKSHQPDIIFTDIKMPKLSGIEATKVIHSLYPSIGIIALSMFNDDIHVVDMLESGALGYLLKSADKHDIIDAINSVQLGNPYYCQSTSARLTIAISKSKFNPYKEADQSNLFLPNEIEIIQMICEELSTKEIGDRLYKSSRTIEGYRVKILEKMKVKNTAGIVIYAIKNDLFKLK